jgi:hypothetical protein
MAPYNVAIACGSAGLLVLDLDSPGVPADARGQRRHGRQVLAELVQAVGAENPTATYTVATPTGEHRYLTVDADRPGRCTTGVLGPDVDTRAIGGYVVAAGSVRLVEGRRRYYRVVSPDGLGPVPAPGWLLAALDPTPAAGSPDRVRVGSGDPFPAGYGAAALAGETARVRIARTGTRNRDVFIAAVHLGQLTAAGLLDERHVTEVLRAAARIHVGVDGFTAAEVDRAIANGLRYGLRRPRPVPPAGHPDAGTAAAER